MLISTRIICMYLEFPYIFKTLSSYKIILYFNYMLWHQIGKTYCLLYNLYPVEHDKNKYKVNYKVLIINNWY